jgi:hypothetical protein
VSAFAASPAKQVVPFPRWHYDHTFHEKDPRIALRLWDGNIASIVGCAEKRHSFAATSWAMGTN